MIATLRLKLHATLRNLSIGLSWLMRHTHPHKWNVDR